MDLSKNKLKKNKINKRDYDMINNINLDWSLDNIVNNIEEEMRFINNLVNSFRKKEEYFKSITPKKLFDLIKDLEIIKERISIINAYVDNHLAIDSTNQNFIKLKNIINNQLIIFYNKLLFVKHKIQKLPEKKINYLLKNSLLKDYSYFLKRIYESKNHSLSKKEESLLIEINSFGYEAEQEIYNQLTTTFNFYYKRKKVNQSFLLKKIRSFDFKEREDAYKSLLKPYLNNKEVLFTIYDALAKNWIFESKKRKYKKPISMRNFDNELTDKTVEELLEVINEEKYVFEEYFIFKAKELNIPLNRYHIYAPISEIKEEFDIKKSLSIVLETFNDFHPSFYKNLIKLIKEKRIDFLPKERKRTGAYCYPISPNKTPLVLLNHNNTIDSVFTMAHEFGHAIHFLLSSKNNYFNYDMPLPIAETASTFSELLLLDKLKKSRPDLKKKLLFDFLADSYATILRQSYFTIFEEKSYELIEKGSNLEEISLLYYNLLKEQFGKKMKIPKEFSYEFLYVPHLFFSPFYCYAYSFGKLLAITLFANYKKDLSFKEKIIDFLSKGGSNRPEKIIKDIGLKLNKSFWKEGFDYLKKELNELKNLD